MAVTFICGYELNQIQAEPSGQSLSGTIGYTQFQVRTGTWALRANPASTNNGFVIPYSTTAGWLHFGLYVATKPTVSRTIVGAYATDYLSVKLTSTGALAVYDGTTLLGTSSTAFASAGWHWVGVRRTSGTSVVHLQIDGVNEVSGTSTFTNYQNSIGFADAEASSADIYIDDVIIDDAGFLSPSKVALLVPVSDGANSSSLWKTGDGTGTTNLYAAVDNAPPAGVASASETASTNIECADKNLINQYAANLTSYTSAGVGSSDTLLALQAFAQHGEDISTGTKTGNLGYWANPNAGIGSSFTFGGDAGAHGASPTNWATTTLSVVTNLSGVTLGSPVGIYVQKTDSTTRVACVSFMGAYVAWTPSTGTTVSGSFTANAYIKKVGTAGSFTANANIRKTGVAGSFTADAFVKRLGLGGSFTADASVSKRTTQTFTADANIRRTGLAGSFTADSYIKRTGLGSSFTANAYLKRLGLSGSFTANAYVKKTGQQGSFTADAHIRRTGIASSFTADSFVKRLGLGGSLTADAYVKRVFGGSFTADAQIAVNAVTQTGSFTANAYIKKVQSASFTADANLRRTGIAASFTADSFVKRVGQSGSFTADAHLRKTGISATFTADAFVKRLGLSGSFAANAFVKRTGQPGSFTADAYIKRAGQPGSFTADAFVKRVFAGSFTADSNIRATVAGSLTSDAYIKRAGQAGSLTADAYIKRVQSASLTADAIIRKTGIGGTFTADAEVGRVARVYWTTPGNNSTIGFTPTLNFVIPTSIGPVHFDLQLDTVNTFDGVDFREYRSSRDQTGWEYWNGAAWTAVPQSGVPTGNAGNEARFTVPTSLSAGTWYRRIRAGA